MITGTFGFGRVFQEREEFEDGVLKETNVRVICPVDVNILDEGAWLTLYSNPSIKGMTMVKHGLHQFRLAMLGQVPAAAAQREEKTSGWRRRILELNQCG